MNCFLNETESDEIRAYHVSLKLKLIFFCFQSGCFARDVSGSQRELADAAEAHDLQRVVAGEEPQQHEHAQRHVHLRPGNNIQS